MLSGCLKLIVCSDDSRMLWVSVLLGGPGSLACVIERADTACLIQQLHKLLIEPGDNS